MSKNNRSVSNKFGSLIKHQRELKGYSLKEMEQITGVSATYICRLESGERKAPSVPILQILADTLGIEVSELLDVSTIKDNSEVKSLTELLLTNDFSVNDTIFEKRQKELLISILEKITIVEWSEETKIQDSFEILQLVDDFKEEMAG